MNIKLLIGLLTAISLLTGCISMGGREPAPVSEASTIAAPVNAGTEQSSGGVQIRAYTPAAPVAAPEPVHGGPVVALLKQSKQQESRGENDRAVATLERALRIEPRSAHLWNRLAHLRLAQKRAVLAAEMAAKSTALAGGDTALKRDNWLLIAEAKRAIGDLSGARLAEKNARALY